jgi:hypothetical protein
MTDNKQTLIDNTGRVLMVWHGPQPTEPEAVRKFIGKILNNKDKRKRGKVV